jgi:hypothetical protein
MILLPINRITSHESVWGPSLFFRSRIVLLGIMLYWIQKYVHNLRIEYAVNFLALLDNMKRAYVLIVLSETMTQSASVRAELMGCEMSRHPLYDIDRKKARSRTYVTNN